MIKHSLIGLVVLALSATSYAEDKLNVFAAASLTNAITDINAQYEKETGVKVTHSFASSATLAKQIENGAPADVFISADTKWMDYLQNKALINRPTRKNLLGNHLVLIAPKGSAFEVKFSANFDFSHSFNGKLCTGDTESVPVGIYAKEALTTLNWWQGIKSRIVGAQDVRGVLAFVERGECPAGIVYETDAKLSTKVDLVGVFPESTHSPVVYPIASLTRAKAASEAYMRYLSSPSAILIFKKYGFDTNR